MHPNYPRINLQTQESPRKCKVTTKFPRLLLLKNGSQKQLAVSLFSGAGGMDIGTAAIRIQSRAPIGTYVMNNQTLSTLTPVGLREIWTSEDSDFTPWLAQEQNLAILGETLGIELELEAQEKAVGPFRADI